MYKKERDHTLKLIKNLFRNFFFIYLKETNGNKKKRKKRNKI
jgi:hypothetical protein